MNIPKIIDPLSDSPSKPSGEGWGRKATDLLTEAISQGWGQKTIDLLAESINHQIDWAKERSKDHECCFYLSIGGEKPEDEYDIPLLIGMIPSKGVLDNLVERLFFDTAWKLECSSIHQPVPWGGKTVYRIKWERR